VAGENRENPQLAGRPRGDGNRRAGADHVSRGIPDAWTGGHCLLDHAGGCGQRFPRRLNAAELTLQEMHSMAAELAEELKNQSLLSAEELEPLLAVPSKQDVERLSVPSALLLMFMCDLKRPFHAARVRRRAVAGLGRIRTFWGLLPSNQANLEKVIDLARQRSWMATKLSFMAKTQQVFHLWHVVHRPFSISFAILAIVHICVALTMGYF
jgi:hypothetical protein